VAFPPVLAAMSRAAGLVLRAGRVRLTGLVPNGQRFVANPLNIWVARESSARLQGADLGVMGPAPEQCAPERLRDTSARRVRRGPRLLRLRLRA